MLQPLTFEDALGLVLQHEGGFVNHPQDPGGMTNLGVTRRVWEEWLGHPVTEKEMKALTPAVVAPMYRQKYWDKVSNLPAHLTYCAFDFAVNSGPGRAIKILQECAGLVADGIIGPKTKSITVSVDQYCDARLSYLKSLPHWPTFGKGWERRVEDVRKKMKGSGPGLPIP